ncbi:MAG: class I SAM-dependent methyltransferase [Promethearchaeota archaeon]|nr:MAG: class I SAM-dependent methyltransferase [Candidatus Lokiarchaeota archaeon]
MNKDENSDKKMKMMKKYNLSSEFYDQRYENIQRQKYEIILTRKYIQGGYYLDIGCGTGLFFDMLRNFLGKRVYYFIGMDISIKMLQKFDEKLNNLNKKKRRRLSLLVADLEHLPFREKSFSTFFSFTTFQNTESFPKAFKEVKRVAQKNSTMISSILKKSKSKEIFLDQINKNLKESELIVENLTEDILVRGFIK